MKKKRREQLYSLPPRAAREEGEAKEGEWKKEVEVRTGRRNGRRNEHSKENIRGYQVPIWQHHLVSKIFGTTGNIFKGHKNRTNTL